MCKACVAIPSLRQLAAGTVLKSVVYLLLILVFVIDKVVLLMNVRVIHSYRDYFSYSNYGNKVDECSQDCKVCVKMYYFPIMV